VLSDQQQTYIHAGGQSKADHPSWLLIPHPNGDNVRRGQKNLCGLGVTRDRNVVVDDASVSRQHANVGRRTDGWWFVDHSNSGSIHRWRTRQEKKITEQTVVQLGHPEAGYQLTLVPVADVASAQKAIVGKRRRKRSCAGPLPLRWWRWWAPGSPRPCC